MKHYKDSKGRFFGYEENAVIPEGLIEVTLEEIKEANEVTRKELFDALPYSEKRASAYPSIADQLDQIYHEGIDAWKETIAAVKAEYPKP